MKYLMLTSLLLAASCTGTDEDVADTTARGVCAHEDAAATEPARPAAQTMFVEIAVRGTGELSGLASECGVDGLAGEFAGWFTGDAHVDDEGVYVAGLASAVARFETPSGCAIPDVQIAVVEDVVVRAYLEATAPNCEAHCRARARSRAETRCGAGEDAAQCRAEAEAEVAGTCSIACEDADSYAIVAEAELSAEAIASINAQELTGAALGEISVDLTFDRIEREDGSVVSEP